jgi:hypothetical protein
MGQDGIAAAMGAAREYLSANPDIPVEVRVHIG